MTGPITNTATAFVLTIRNASVHLIFPVIGNDGAVLCPSEHREWAHQIGEKWQTVDLESCIVREQQGFICESNAILAQDVCLDTEQNICHLEIHPNKTSKTVLLFRGNGSACSRTAWDSVFLENVIVNTKNHSKFCAGNFTQMARGDFSEEAPVTSHHFYNPITH